MSLPKSFIAGGLATWLMILSPAVASGLKSGDILVADRTYGLIVVDPVDGSQSYLTGFFNGHGFADVVTNEAGKIYALDSQGVIVAVDAATGAVTPISSGGYLTSSNCMDLSPDGSLIAQAGAPSYGLVKVDPGSGSQTLIAPGLPVDALAVIDAGTAYVMSYPSGSTTQWYAYHLNFATGDTLRVSNVSFFNPRALAIESASSFIAVEAYGIVSRVFPALGSVAPIASGPPFQGLTGVAVEPGGRILVADPQGNPSCNPPGPASTCRGAVYAVSGAPTVVSEQGKFDIIAGLAVYVGPSTPTRASTWGRVKVLYR